MRENLELIFRIVTQNQGALRQIANDTRSVKDAATESSSAVDRLIGSLNGGGNAAGLLGGKLGLVTGAALAAGAGLALAATKLATWTDEAMRGAKATTDLAVRMQLTVKEARQLETSARLAEVNVGALEGVARHLGSTSQETSAALRELGVSTVTVTGEKRALGAVALDVVAKLSQVGDTTRRAQLAQKALGEQATELQPLIARYSELAATSAKLGETLDAQAIGKLAEARSRIVEMTTAWDAFKTSLAARIAPIVIEILPKIGRGNGVLRKEDLDRMGVTVPQRFGGSAPGGSQADTIFGAVERFDDLQAGAAAIARFNRQAGGSERRLRESLKDIDKRITEIDSVLRPNNAGTLGGKAATRLIDEYNALEAKRKAIEQQLKNLDKNPVGDRADSFRKLLDGLNKQGLDPLARLLSDTHAKLQEIVRENGPRLPGQVAALDAALEGAIKRLPPRTVRPNGNLTSDLSVGAFLAGGLRPVATSVEVDPDRAEAAQRRFQNLRLQSMDRALRYQERLIELQAGPGGELDAINRIAQVRLQAAEQQYAIEKDLAAYKERQHQIDQDRTIAILELQRRRTEQYREAAGRVFDAITTGGGGGGLRDLLAGQLRLQQRAIFQNVSESIFRQAGGTLGRIGAASGLGGLLRGTLFDPANAQKPEERLVASQDRLRQSTDRLTAAIDGTAAGGEPGGAVTSSTASIASRLPRASTVGSFLAGAETAYGHLFAGLKSGDRSIQTGDGQATTASALGLTSTAGRVGNVAASGAILFGGAMGIRAGLQEGGARGAVTSVASALGVASAIPGPQQPFLAAAAVVAGVVRGLFPDPKKEREEGLLRAIRDARYADPVGRNSFTDQSGADLSYDRRGQIRPAPAVTVNISAMDSKSILDRAGEIADAVHRAVRGGHDLGDSMRELVLVP